MRKVILNTSQYCHLINDTDIVYCKHAGGFTHFFFNNKNEIKVQRPLISFINQLSDDLFMYTHRSFLVNRTYIESFHQKPNLHLVMTNDYKVPVSVRRKKEVEQYIQETHQVQI